MSKAPALLPAQPLAPPSPTCAGSGAFPCSGRGPAAACGKRHGERPALQPGPPQTTPGAAGRLPGGRWLRQAAAAGGALGAQARLSGTEGPRARFWGGETGAQAAATAERRPGRGGGPDPQTPPSRPTWLGGSFSALARRFGRRPRTGSLERPLAGGGGGIPGSAAAVCPAGGNWGGREGGGSVRAGGEPRRPTRAPPPRGQGRGGGASPTSRRQQLLPGSAIGAAAGDGGASLLSASPAAAPEQRPSDSNRGVLPVSLRALQ